jgi:uncharacterized membrane protein YoaK (UPF0700 family)
MTAFGFVLFILGILTAAAYHDRFSREWSIGDTVASILLVVGIISMVAGITIWLYRVMP